jgi:hypothetical protein
MDLSVRQRTRGATHVLVLGADYFEKLDLKGSQPAAARSAGVGRANRALSYSVPAPQLIFPAKPPR